MSSPQSPHPSLEQSERFRTPPKRRDFLGLAAVWSTVVAFLGALIGSMRLPMPAVFPESSAQVKIGPPEDFPKGSVVPIKHLNAWVFHDEKGLYVISAICTHLGCVTARDPETGIFHCPCHGSVFQPDGKVIAGPAPKPLNWLATSVAPDGQIVVNQWRFVPLGSRLTVSARPKTGAAARDA